MKQTTRRFLEIKAKVEKAQTKADKAKGALSEIKDRLEKEFGCDSLKAAKKKLKDLQRQESDLTKQLDKAMTNFEDKWDEKVED